MGHITILTGAGFVKPLGLPTTTEFSMPQNLFLSALQGYLRSEGKSPKDIEHVLAETEEFLKGEFSYFQVVNRYSGTCPQVVSELQNLKRNAEVFSVELKKSIYRQLRKFDESEAFELYFNFLKLFNPRENKISFFTTNYDRTFERSFFKYRKAFEEIGIRKVVYHFVEDSGDLVFKPSYKYRGFEYVKLHGSLDWYEEDGVVVKTSAAVLPDNPDEPPLLYPGYKTMPDREPFVSLHRIFLDRLFRSEIVVIVGFALRDEVINFLLDVAMSQREKLRIFFINPSHEFPPESGYEHFLNVYGKRFLHIPRAIEVSDSPLGVSSLQELLELGEGGV